MKALSGAILMLAGAACVLYGAHPASGGNLLCWTAWVVGVMLAAAGFDLVEKP